MVAIVRDEDNFTSQLSLSPCSQYFATPQDTGAHVYSTDGTLKAVLGSELPASRHPPARVAWSPDGCHLAFWQPGQPRNHSELLVFETEQWTLVRSVMVKAGPKEGCAGLLWGLHGLMPVIWKDDQFASPWLPLCQPGSLLIANEQADSGFLPLHEMVKVSIGSCPPVVCEDGAFVAVIGCDHYQFHVLDSSSGARVFSDTIPGAVANAGRFMRFFSLAWAGKRLLVKHLTAPGRSEILKVVTF